MVINVGRTKQLDPGVQLLPAVGEKGGVPVFLKKAIEACDFPGGGGVRTLCPLSGSTHDVEEKSVLDKREYTFAAYICL